MEEVHSYRKGCRCASCRIQQRDYQRRWRAGVRVDRTRKTHNCLACGVETYNPKFCSRSCAATWNQGAAATAKVISSRRKASPKICPVCGKEFVRPNGQTKGAVNCSRNCAAVALKKELKVYPKGDEIRKIDKYIGYARIYLPGHPEANTRGYVYEHRVIAEQSIGRRLEKNEVVHHINGIRHDNRPENLQVMDRIEHSKLRKEKCE